MSSDLLARYRAVDYPLPKTYLAWELYGAGPENFGRDKTPVELPLREPADNEVLLRVDAVGICFSDTKLVWAGPEHPRIPGRDLANDPTVPGHEAALTVVQAGAKWRDKFSRGDRYIVQADVFIDGEQKAFGYVQRGAFAQYVYAGPMVLDGDDGCYLLPLQDQTGYAEAALVEPWACVVSAYRTTQRTAPLAGGRLLVLFTQPQAFDFTNAYAVGEEPGSIVAVGELDADLTPILGDTGRIIRHAPTADEVAGLCAEETAGRGFDDIFLIGAADTELTRACDTALADGGFLAFFSAAESTSAGLDMGRVHYKGTRHVGSTAFDVAQAYAVDTRGDILPGGVMWIAGGTGPMGQMHLQRALEHASPPRAILATGREPSRLEYIRERFAPAAEARGIQLIIRPASEVADLRVGLAEMGGAAGFDDLLINAPVPELVTQATEVAAPGAVINVFAGMKLGTLADVSPMVFTEKRVRIIGSSGSSMTDIRDVLDMVEADTLATRKAVGAIGDLSCGWEGLVGVQERRYPGKTVLFPQLENLPLMTPDKLAEQVPAAAEKFAEDGTWTTEAETALFAALLTTEE